MHLHCEESCKRVCREGFTRVPQCGQGSDTGAAAESADGILEQKHVAFGREGNQFVQFAATVLFLRANDSLLYGEDALPSAAEMVGALCNPGGVGICCTPTGQNIVEGESYGLWSLAAVVVELCPGAIEKKTGDLHLLHHKEIPCKWIQRRQAEVMLLSPASRFEGPIDAQLILMQVMHGDAMIHSQNAAELIEEPVPVQMLNDGSWRFFLDLGLPKVRKKAPETRVFTGRFHRGLRERKNMYASRYILDDSLRET